ncbi:MAG: pyridoxal phosphate-dependent aminotransferase [Eggerthellaceae bacterium]|jgi:aspartate aminotransferase
MFNSDMYALGAAPSSIRELFAYGLARKAEIGADKVFDFSLGNPSVPAPPQVADALREAIELPPEQLHSYSMAQGAFEARDAIAENLNERFDAGVSADDLYLTAGAAGALTCTLRALIAGESPEVIVVPPYFPEYRMWIQSMGATCVEVPARTSDFQLDVPAIEAAITANTRAIIINTPNNPVGVVYSPEILAELNQALQRKRKELGTPVYVISDEPYRELLYTGKPITWVPSIIDTAIVCYSWSKSLSLPGERIGYVLVPPTVPDARDIYLAVCGAGRALGYVCAPVLFQRVAQKCCGVPADVDAYVRNRKLLTGIMDDLGYTYIEPQGAFYLWIKALEPDAQAFSEKAKAHELLLVASDSFGVKGWVRAGYCVDEDTIRNSRDAFAALKKDYE